MEIPKRTKSFWWIFDVVIWGTFFALIDIGVDVFGRMYIGDFLTGVFGGFGGWLSRILMSFAIAGMLYMVKKVLRIVIHKIRKGDIKMLKKLLKWFFRSDFKLYKLLFKAPTDKQEVEQLVRRVLDDYIAEKKQKEKIAPYEHKADEMIIQKYCHERDAIAKRLANEQTITEQAIPTVN